MSRIIAPWVRPGVWRAALAVLLASSAASPAYGQKPPAKPAAPAGHGLGNKPHPAAPTHLLTESQFKTILERPSANPGLLSRRIALGFVKPTVANAEFSPLLPSNEHPPTLRSYHLALTEAKTPAGGRPAAVDWRNRWGWNWITPVRDQGNTENCWAFASTALVEAMVRIEHGVWCELAEVELRKGVHKTINDGGNASEALNWAEQHGQADALCSPYTEDDLPLKSAPDRSGRTIRLPKHTRVKHEANHEAAKRWLDAVGPMCASFAVYTDFDAMGNGANNGFSKGEVYRHADPKATLRGNHLILVVGYDDAKKCWVCKNSWGTGFGEGGFFRIGYGVANIDNEEMYGVSRTNPDPYTKRNMHAGAMLEGGNGEAHRNFELLATGGPGHRQLVHWWRQGGEGGNFTWHQDPPFAKDVAAAPTLIATTYNRNFESVHRTTAGRLHHWFYDQAAKKWADGGVFGPADAHGIPGFVQGSHTDPGDFEVVVAVKGGKLDHWTRGHAPSWAWKEVARFGTDIAHSGPSLVQARDAGSGSKKGALHLVAALSDGRMQEWAKADAVSAWKPVSGEFGTGIATGPCMIQGEYGMRAATDDGNFELCVAAHGKVEHWWRVGTGGPWQRSAVFGQDVKSVAALVEGSVGFNLEVVVVRTDGKMQHYWRDGRGWHAGVVIGPA